MTVALSPSRTRATVEDVQFTLQRVPYASPEAQALCAEVQAEYVSRYGDGDLTVLADGDFDPPSGDFLIAYDQTGEPVGCGGWRTLGQDDAEMKRVYVRESSRRRGLARQLVAAIEASAAEAGRKRLVLETGPRQPEAIAMYRALGYSPVVPFGVYAKYDDSLHLGKELGSAES